MGFIKGFGTILMLMVYVMGVIGGFGYLAHYGCWLFAICVLCVGAMAFPFVKSKFKTNFLGDGEV